MMISVWSGTWPSFATCSVGVSPVTFVALVPGAGDWVVGVSGVASLGAGASCAKAGETSAVDASRPSVSARSLTVVIDVPLDRQICQYCDREARHCQRR